MALYKVTFTRCTDPQLWQRVAPALAEVGAAVMAEPVNTPEHAARLALAVFAGPRTDDYVRCAKEMQLFLLTVNPDLLLTSTDPVLKAAVEAAWTPYAKALVAKGLITVA